MKKIIVLVVNFILITNILSKELSKDYYIYKDYFFTGQEFTPDEEILKNHDNNLPFIIPFMESVLFNFTLTRFNRYVLKRESSHITFDTIKDNFQHGFDWDTDALSTNFFMHPIQGSIYFNTARANGFSIEHSYSMALLGSLQWEFFMEVTPPSINDLIITSVSGAFLGEMFFQITSLILDDSQTGFSRAFTEISSGLIAPGRFFSRLANGSAYRHTKYKLYSQKKYKFNLGLGLNYLSDKDDISSFDGTPELTLNIEFEYGNPFNVKKIKLLKYFDLRVMLKVLRVERESLLSVIDANGILFGRHYVKDNHHIILSFNQYFNYFNTEIYQIGALKLGPTIRYRSKVYGDFALEFKLGLTAVPMSGILSTYSKYHLVEKINKSKEYNTSWGGSVDFSVKLLTKYVNFKLDYILWVLKTFDNVDAGALGTEISSMLKPSIEANIKKIILRFELLSYYNEGKYINYPDSKRTINELRFVLGYRF